jgi:hypothetical protein
MAYSIQAMTENQMHKLNHDDFTIGLPVDWTDDSVVVISGPEGVSRNSIARDLSITPAELNSLIAGLTISAVESTNEVTPIKRDEPQERPTFRLV